MEYISQLFYQISSFLMSVLMAVGAITVPSTENVIVNIAEDTVLDFVVIGDTQVCDYIPSREQALISLSKDINNSDIELDAFIIAGDIAENGMQQEFDRVYDHICDFNTSNYIMVAGNHDIRLREYEQCKDRLLAFMTKLNKGENEQTSLHYKYEINGYTFLIMGSDDADFEKATISDAQLQWLNIELKAASKEGKPVFVICHYPLAESHGLPGTWGSATGEDPTGTLPTYVRKDSYDITGSIGYQSNRVYDIISKYKNVVFITGHLHTGFGKDSYQVLNEENNVIGINVPSVGIENKDGVYNDTGTGYFVEVTPTNVYFRARDFAKGKNLPEHDIVIDVK